MHTPAVGHVGPPALCEGGEQGVGPSMPHQLCMVSDKDTTISGLGRGGTKCLLVLQNPFLTLVSIPQSLPGLFSFVLFVSSFGVKSLCVIPCLLFNKMNGCP